MSRQVDEALRPTRFAVCSTLKSSCRTSVLADIPILPFIWGQWSHRPIPPCCCTKRLKASSGPHTQRHDSGALALAMSRPRGHQFASLVERIAAPIGLLGRVAGRMSERRFANLAREACLVASPIAERRTEAVRRYGAAHVLKLLWKRPVVERSASPRKDKIVHPNRRHFGEDRERRIREWNAMPARGLHARGGNGPHARLEVYFFPTRAQRLVASSRGQDGELKSACWRSGLLA